MIWRVESVSGGGSKLENRIQRLTPDNGVWRAALEYLRFHNVEMKACDNFNWLDLFFPDYIFGQIDNNTDDARKVRSTCCVASIFGVCNRAGALPDAFIEATCNSTHEIHNQASTDLTPRQKVGIARGPFAALVAKLIRVDAN